MSQTLRPYRYPIAKFVAISAGVAGLTNFVIKAVLSELGYGSIILIGIVSSVVGLFWFLFDRIMWKWPPFRWIGLSNLPNLNGKWLGEVNRVGESTPHQFIMEISQTYTHMSIKTNTENSKSTSMSTSFMVDETGTNYDLLNYWTCTTKRRAEPVALEDFKGFSYLDIKRNGTSFVLCDHYFTDRNPPTKGIITLTRQ